MLAMVWLASWVTMWGDGCRQTGRGVALQLTQTSSHYMAHLKLVQCTHQSYLHEPGGGHGRISWQQWNPRVSTQAPELAPGPRVHGPPARGTGHTGPSLGLGFPGSKWGSSLPLPMSTENSAVTGKNSVSSDQQ